MPNLESIEAGRSMHQQGMEYIAGLDWVSNGSPVGALAVVHNILIVPDVIDVESINISYGVLSTRLQQPDALKYRESPRGLKLLAEEVQSAFLTPEQMQAGDNRQKWKPAMEIIRKPIDRYEIDIDLR